VNYTEQEIQLIENARSKASNAAIVRIVLLLVLVVSIAFMLAGYLALQAFALLAVALAVVAILQMQLLPGPQYEDLVGLLVNKIPDPN